MNRRLSMLCLLVAAGALLFATGARAVDVPFQVETEWEVVITGQLEHFPVLDVSAVSTAVESSTCDIDRATLMFTVDADTGVISEGQIAYVTDSGDVLYGHVSGGSWPMSDGLSEAQMDLEFVGGTGQFAAVRGSAGWESEQTVVTWWPSPYVPLMETAEDQTDGTLTLADWRPMMVSAKLWEGEPVPGSLVLEPEALDPLTGLGVLFTEGRWIGHATQWGQYVAARRAFIDLRPLSVGMPIQACGFYTATIANGDVGEGYWEVQMVPQAEHPDANDAALQVWRAGGTGKCANASGYLSGWGLYWSDGREDLFCDGMASSVASSMREWRE